MKHNRTTMGLVRAVIICAVLGLTSGAHGPGSKSYVTVEKFVGDTALFNTSRDPTPFTHLLWTFGTAIPIITVNASGNYTSASYEDRITLFNNGSLELRNITLDDDGYYMVRITSTEGQEFRDVFALRVLEPVSNVSLSASATDLIEYDVVKLTCSASGSALRFSWFNNSHTMEEFPTSSTEYINVFVKRYDTGPFTCVVHNLISSISSEGVNFTISYRPDVEVKAVPLKDTYADGSNVTLVCTVDSKPEAEISWYYNYLFDDKRLLPFNGTEIVLEDLTWEKSGFYRCQAYNRKADLYGWKEEYISVEYKSRDDGLSIGASLGIALACAAVGAGVGSGLAYLYHRYQKRRGAR